MHVIIVCVVCMLCIYQCRCVHVCVGDMWVHILGCACAEQKLTPGIPQQPLGKSEFTVCQKHWPTSFPCDCLHLPLSHHLPALEGVPAPAFNTGSRDLSSGSHGCTAGILCTQPSHSLRVHLKFKVKITIHCIIYTILQLQNINKYTEISKHFIQFSLFGTVDQNVGPHVYWANHSFYDSPPQTLSNFLNILLFLMHHRFPKVHRHQLLS